MNTYFSKWEQATQSATVKGSGYTRHSYPYDSASDDEDEDEDEDEVELEMIYDENFHRRLEDHRRHWQGEWAKVDMLRAELFQLATGEDSSPDMPKYGSKRGSSESSLQRDSPHEFPCQEERLRERNGPCLGRYRALLPDDSTLSTASTASVKSTCSQCCSEANSKTAWEEHSKRFSVNCENDSAELDNKNNPSDFDKNRRSISSHGSSPSPRECTGVLQTKTVSVDRENIGSDKVLSKTRHQNSNDVVTHESQDQICITLDLNGFNPAEISVTIVKGIIKVNADKNRLRKNSDRNVNTSERSIELPSNVHPNDVRASVTDVGHLQIKAPLRQNYTRRDSDITRSVPLVFSTSGRRLQTTSDGNLRNQPTQLSFGEKSSTQPRQISPNNNSTAVAVPVVSPVTMEAVLDYRGRVSNRTTKYPKTFLQKLFSG